MTTHMLDAMAALTKRAEGEKVRVRPRADLNEELRARINASTPAELFDPMRRIDRADRTLPDELAEMHRIALADPVAAWESFTFTAAAEAIR